MNEQQIEEVIDCLPQDRTLLHYYRDRYAVYLLARALKREAIASVSAIKRTRFAKYLEKPVINSVLAKHGEDLIDPGLLTQCWPEGPGHHTDSYRLSLDSWGDSRHRSRSWLQTTRRGHNLVLQLNFTTQHDSDFRAWTGIDEEQAFNCWGHPISMRCDNTLAWSRLDIDMESGAVLVEEIQTDWVRIVNSAVKSIERSKQPARRVEVNGVECSARGLLSYHSQILAWHQQLWSEAMLFATIWFVHGELGIDDIYYHTAETGAVMKGIRYGKPPRSLYSDLPRKFCFEKTTETPAFLLRCGKARRRLKKVSQPTWFKLAV